MPPPAAADLAAAGLLLTVDPPRAIVTLSPPTDGNGGSLADYDTWFMLAAIGRGLPGDVRTAVIRGNFASGGPLDLATEPNSVDGIAGSPAARSAAGGPSAGPAGAVERLASALQDGSRWLGRPDLVSVAAVAGPARGPGAQLALACDLRIVADNASFALPEVAAGTIPFLGATAALVAAVGYAQALEICVTGRVVGAREAVDIGLAQLVVPAADLDVTVDGLAAALAAAPRAAAAEVKALLLAARRERPGPGDALAAEREAAARCLIDPG